MVKNKLNLNKGFTLIEMIVVIALLLLILMVSIELNNSIIKGSMKSEITKDLKQSGNYALSVMDRAIRNANGIESCTTNMTSISLSNNDGSVASYTFTADNIASSGANLLGSGYTIVTPGDASSFNCVSTEGSPPIVTIKFTLEKGSASTRSAMRLITATASIGN